MAQINDSDAPFRSLQAAIDAMHDNVWGWNPPQNPPPGNPETIRPQGVIFALPGLYGPHGSSSSGDSLPIKMRDRVHVRGLGARRVILRGANIPNVYAHWPISQPAMNSSLGFVEVLLDLSDVNACHPGPPGGFANWCQQEPPSEGDTLEIFDGFTFQGGDVQVLAQGSNAGQVRALEQAVVISNCVFDMRHDWVDDATGNTIPGPFIGVYMLKPLVAINLSSGPYGYPSQRLLIMNNTFVMAQRGPLAIGGSGWVEECRRQAVGILDVTDPSCIGNVADCDTSHRGLGNPGIINNVFRTRNFDNPPPHVPYAMLGIDEADTRMALSGAGPLVRSNAFAGARNGASGSNGYFHSSAVVPVQADPPNPAYLSDGLWYCNQSPCVMFPPYDCAMGNQGPNCANAGCSQVCTPAALPTPAVPIYDGSSTEVDPGFIGEYLSMNVGGLEDYVDWRLLPGSYPVGSPLKDAGHLPGGHTITMENGTVFELSNRPELSPLTWDGEHFGNPRVVDGAVDIGFDEVHLFTMAGSYGNNSSSHNNNPTSNSLNKSAPPGKPERYVFVRGSAGGIDLVQGNQIKLHGTLEVPVFPPPAWDVPPATLSTPLVGSGYPAGYETKYISFNNQGTPAPPTPFTENLTQSSFILGWDPLGAGTNFFEFVLMTPPNSLGQNLNDDEGTSHAYFNTQALILSAPNGTKLLRGNLQVEYR